jgi:hypothetical protein
MHARHLLKRALTTVQLARCMQSTLRWHRLKGKLDLLQLLVEEATDW